MQQLISQAVWFGIIATCRIDGQLLSAKGGPDEAEKMANLVRMGFDANRPIQWEYNPRSEHYRLWQEEL